MLSICNQTYPYLFRIIEEAGGKWIVKDPNTGIYLFSSPDPNRQGDYFKLLDRPSSKNYGHIARIGIRNPNYEIHYKDDIKRNVFLKPERIDQMTALLGDQHNPDSSNRKLIEDLLREKNMQIDEFNRANGQHIPNINHFTNWQAAIIYTNLINRHNQNKIIRNDNNFGDVDNTLIPFSQPMPEYTTGLLNSEEAIKHNIKESRKYKRY